MQNVLKPYITKTPGLCGGKACIAGHRIRVMDIVIWHEMRGMSPEEILHILPGITLAEVHAALAYSFDNRDEIQADFHHEQETAEAFRHKFPSIPREKLGVSSDPV